MSKATVCGAIRNLNVVEADGGAHMCTFDMVGESGINPAVVFPEDFSSCSLLLKDGVEVKMHGYKPPLEHVARFIVTDVYPWDQD